MPEDDQSPLCEETCVLTFMLTSSVTASSVLVQGQKSWRSPVHQLMPAETGNKPLVEEEPVISRT